MNKYALLLILLSPLSVFAAGETSDIQANGGIPAKKDFKAQYGVVQTQADGDRLLKIPEVQNFFEQCKSEFEQTRTDVSDCLWTKVNADDAVREKVQEEMAKMNKTFDNKDLNYEGRTLSNIRINTVATDPTKKFNDKDKSPQQKLEDYLFKKFTEALYEKKGDKKTMVMNHRLFEDLYKSQLGKNLIAAISSYALESENVAGVCLHAGTSDSEIDRVRRLNLAKLETPAAPTQDPGAANNKQSGQVPAAYNDWALCARQIEMLCTTTAIYAPVKATDPQNKTRFDSRIQSSQRKSCIVYRYMKDTRRALIDMEKVDEGWKKLKDDSYSEAGNFSDRLFDENKTNEMINLSSQELIVDSGYEDAVKKREEELKKCAEDYDGNKENCDKYLLGSKEDNDKIMAEANLRLQAQNKKINDDLLNADADQGNQNLKKYLEEEGRTEEQVAAILSQTQDKINQLREDIKRQHRLETEAIKNALKEKLDSITIDQDPAHTAERNNTMKRIQGEFERRPDQMKQLIFFNNVVSGFIQVRDNTGNTSSNTAALNAELRRSAMITDNRAPASGQGTGSNLPQVDIDKIKALAPTGGGSTSGGAATLDVGQINDSFIIKEPEKKP
ncbi:MAG: hypothetical protein Fur0010_17050 [Bdellovibrio sp.]